MFAAALSAGLAGPVPFSPPAWAHGATADPVSRAVACGPQGGAAARSAACRAANRVGGARASAAWDEIRVANVNGRDRRMIPDGRLCSGGIDRFHGLDLARTDWPATRLTAGARFRFGYRVSIPHRGTLRLYATRAGHVPSRPLRWADLQTRPFLTVTDPPRRGDAYEFTGRLPKGLSGRHVIYMIWQTSDTPDTYYSCSDVVFGSATRRAGSSGAPGAIGAPGAVKTPEARAVPERPATPEPSGAAEPAGTGAVRAEPAAADTDSGVRGRPMPLIIGTAGLAVVSLAGGGLIAVRFRRRGRLGGRPGSP